MSATREAFVAARFDGLSTQFSASVEADDYRLAALVQALGPFEGRRILDVGCGKGRFARRLESLGADIVGIDFSTGMLKEAVGSSRSLGSATRLPFAASSFDALYAVEVFQHLSMDAIAISLQEFHRVLRTGGRLAIVDRNALALDGRRPWLPRALVKRIDECRGLWMYRPGEPARERWFRPSAFGRRIAGKFVDVSVGYLLAPDESSHAVFRRFPFTRSMAIWTAERPGEL